MVGRDPAMSPMTTEKVQVTASSASERLVREKARVIAHGGERQDGDRWQRHPDGPGNAIPQAGVQSPVSRGGRSPH